jgi:hypothetical protein
MNSKGIEAKATQTPHTVPLPRYLKHNPFTGERSTTKATATITVQLWKDPHRPERYIEYVITDELGQPGCSHSEYTHNNKCSNCTLFTTRFPTDQDITVRATTDGEVTIEGTATDGKCYEWKSDSVDHQGDDAKDLDIRWTSIPCE